MIRPFTCICLMLAGGSGLYLYQSKHRASLLDREIARVLKQTDAARDRIGVLRTEWALLNEPDRLAELSQQHLGLRQLSPTQFVAVADLGARLSALTPAPMDEFEMTAQAPSPATPPSAPPSRSAVPAPAAPPRPAPLRTASRVGQEQPRAVQEQREEPTRPPVQVATATVRPVAPPAPAVSVATATPPRPLAASVIGESVIRASALGGARAALPPPTPYGAR